jgi:PAS domain S-box-containing protein
MRSNGVPAGQTSWEGEMFRLLVDNAKDYAIFLIDEQRRVLSWSRGAERLLGYADSEIIGRSADLFFTPEDRKQSVPERELRQALATGRGEDDRWHVRKDGSCFWSSGVMTPLKDEAGALRGFAKIMRDRTELKRAEEELARRTRASEQLRRLYEAALSNTPDLVYVFDLDHRFIYANEGLLALWGKTWDEAIGKNCLELGYPEWHASMHDREIEQVIATQKPVKGEVPFTGTSGRRIYEYIFVPVLGENGEVEAVAGTTRDVTEHRKVEQSLRFLADASATLAAVADYETTLRHVAELAVPYFADGCAVDLLDPDRSLRRVAVVHPDPVKVQLAHELHRRYPPHPDSTHGLPQVLRTGRSDMMADIPDALLAQGATDPDHLRLLRQLGLHSYMCVPLKARGKVLGVVSFVTAESGRRYTESDLAFAEELAQRAGIALEHAQLYAELRDDDRKKDEFLATLAHELRNPLAPVFNAITILQEENLAGEMRREAQQIIDRQVRQLAHLVDDLLDVSRITRGRIQLQVQPVELQTVLTAAVQACRSPIDDHHHELIMSVPPEPIWLDADPTRLEQVVVNLLMNAAKYSKDGSRITITARTEQQQAVVRVRDTGIGIAADMLPQVFDLFRQADRSLDRSKGGLGIGLSLVRKLVELHGGSVEAHSEGLGKGSEFVVRLPVRPAAPQSRSQERTAQAPVQSDHPLRVLVVDDNVDAAETLRLLLTMSGHDIDTAHSGETALQTANDFRPEVVLLDIGLPGLNGYQVAERIRRTPELKKVVLIAMTGYGQEEDRQRTQQAGFNFHLVKPVDPQQLQELLTTLAKK